MQSSWKKNHEIDLNLLAREVKRMQKQGYSEEVLAKELSKEFDISFYYAKALINRVNELRTDDGIVWI